MVTDKAPGPSWIQDFSRITLQFGVWYAVLMVLMVLMVPVFAASPPPPLTITLVLVP